MIVLVVIFVVKVEDVLLMFVVLKYFDVIKSDYDWVF